MATQLIAIMGPTGSGKTGVAEGVADEIGAQLVNADAFQVYRGLDIGTAKPVDRARYALLDVRDPNEPFGLGEWIKLVVPALEAAFAKNQHIVLVGGTGLYIRALMEEYAGMSESPDPELRERLNAEDIEILRSRLASNHPEIAERTDMANPVRVRRALERTETPATDPVRLPAFSKLKFALNPDVDLLNSNLEQRVLQMVQNGWTREIEELRKKGYAREDPGFRAIGYRTFWDYIERKIDLDKAIATTIAETRRYAKRQRTWLRTEPHLVELPVNKNDAIRKAMERIETDLM